MYVSDGVEMQISLLQFTKLRTLLSDMDDSGTPEMTPMARLSR